MTKGAVRSEPLWFLHFSCAETHRPRGVAHTSEDAVLVPSYRILESLVKCVWTEWKCVTQTCHLLDTVARSMTRAIIGTLCSIACCTSKTSETLAETAGAITNPAIRTLHITVSRRSRSRNISPSFSCWTHTLGTIWSFVKRYIVLASPPIITEAFVC